MTDDTEVADKIHALVRQKYAAMEHMPLALLNSSTIEVSRYADYVAESLAIRLTAYVLEEQVEQNYLEYPADWWQAFKERWLPAWARRRWPVRYTRWRADVKAVYPDLIPDQRAIIVPRFTRES